MLGGIRPAKPLTVRLPNQSRNFLQPRSELPGIAQRLGRHGESREGGGGIHWLRSAPWICPPRAARARRLWRYRAV
jgi:hypothetical protein